MKCPRAIDIAFMFPPGGRAGTYRYHLGVAYIQAYLKKNGYNSVQVVPDAGSTLEESAELLLDTGSPVIGFSCFDTNVYLVRFLSAYLKKKKPSIIILTGGPTATFSYNTILNFIPEIDILVRFEGELATRDILVHFLEGKSSSALRKINGICFRDKGKIVVTPERELFSSCQDKGCVLDGLPSPFLEGILKGTEETGVLTTRGCVHHCTYCSFAAMSRRTIRFHSIERIIEELKTISVNVSSNACFGSSAKLIPVNDDAFTLDPRRAKDICRRIIDEKINLKFSCMSRADNLDEELIRLLKEAGFIDVSFGLESAVPEILRVIKKVSSAPVCSEEEYVPEKRFLSKVGEAISLAKKYRMKTSVSVILGLPQETIRQAEETIDFVKKLDVDSYAHNVLVVSEGTEIFSSAGKHNINLKFSERYLRYVTLHSYPVAEVEYLKNSSLYWECRRVAHVFLQACAGIKSIDSNSNKGVITAVVNAGNSAELKDTCLWLSGVLSVGGNVFVVIPADVTGDRINDFVTATLDAGLPTERCYYLRALPSEDKMSVIYRMSEKEIIKWKFEFPFVRFSRYTNMKKITDKEIIPVFSFEEKTDCNVLAVFAEIAGKREEITGEKEAVLLKGVFQDGCKWGRSLCPAFQLRNLVVEKGGVIKPCMGGVSIGRCQDTIEQLRKKSNELYVIARRQRGCDSCPVEAMCAKCLDPSPLSIDEYCRMKRECKDIGNLVITTNLSNTVYASSGN